MSSGPVSPGARSCAHLGHFLYIRCLSFHFSVSRYKIQGTKGSRDADCACFRRSALVLSGGTTSDDGKEFVGSLMIVNVESRAEAQAFVDGDPFTKAGMFRDVRITRMRKGQWNPEAAEGV
ncbi:MAG TPA: YciI family protein [Burkholderiales bacterium]|nr:YciI family protein [Burkholderiales bacterium]